MTILDKDGIKVTIGDKELLQLIASQPKEFKVKLVSDLFGYHGGDEFLEGLATEMSKRCKESCEAFIKISKNATESGTYSKSFCDAYLNVADRYKEQGEIWEQFIKNLND